MTAITTEADSMISVDHTATHRHPLTTVFQELYENGQLIDCHLEIEEKKIPCHWAVVAAYSPVLRCMLSCGMKESLNKTIPVTGFSAHVMESILR
jgi:hypothetical protein